VSYDAAAADRVRHFLSSRDDVVEKRMVGGLSFLVSGNMCCGITGQALMVRVGPHGRERALGEPHVRPSGSPAGIWPASYVSIHQALRLMMRWPVGCSGGSISFPDSQISHSAGAGDWLGCVF
jgi:TfoX N-terminal domain